MIVAVASLSLSFIALCVAGAFYALSLRFRKERNEYAAELAKRGTQLKAAEANHNLALEESHRQQDELTALRVDRQQNWMPKPKHGDGGKFAKKNCPLTTGSEIDAKL